MAFPNVVLDECRWEKVCKIINDFCRPSSIILYGSYARGDFNESSDVDLIVICEDSYSSGYIRELLEAHFSMPFSVLSFNQLIFERSVLQKSPLVWFLREDGRILYDDGYFEKIMPRIVKPIIRFDEIWSRLSKMLHSIESSLEYTIDYTYSLSRLYGFFKNLAILKYFEIHGQTASKQKAIVQIYGSLFSDEEARFIISLSEYFYYMSGVKTEKPTGFSDEKLVLKAIELSKRIKERIHERSN